MGPNVHGFIVELENGSNTSDKGISGPPVAAFKVLVVAQPLGLLVEVGGKALGFGELGDEVRAKVAQL